MESEISDSSEGEARDARYESEQHEGSPYTSRDDYKAEEHKQEFDERNENLEARVQNSNREIPDGEVVIIYHEYPDGRIRALFEEKPKGSREAGKLSLIGGEKAPYDIGPKSTAKREIREEVANEDAVWVLLKALEEDGEEYFVYKGYDASGKQFKVPIRLIKVNSDKDWEKVEKSPLTPATSTDLTGYARSLWLDEIIRKSDSEYAWGYGPIIKEFFRKRHPTQYRLALAGTYSMPIVSTNQSHLQAMEEIIKSNSSLISVDRSMPNLALNYQNTAQKSNFHKPLYTN